MKIIQLISDKRVNFTFLKINHHSLIYLKNLRPFVGIINSLLKECIYYSQRDLWKDSWVMIKITAKAGICHSFFSFKRGFHNTCFNTLLTQPSLKNIGISMRYINSLSTRSGNGLI